MRRNERNWIRANPWLNAFQASTNQKAIWTNLPLRSVLNVRNGVYLFIGFNWMPF